MLMRYPPSTKCLTTNLHCVMFHDKCAFLCACFVLFNSIAHNDAETQRKHFLAASSLKY